jgi:hypothetical protein
VKTQDRDTGFIDAANFSLRSSLKEMSQAFIDAKQVLVKVERGSRKMSIPEAEFFEVLDECCEEFSNVWAQYQQEILGVDKGMGETDIDDKV